ncbi:MAG: hypothetical protein ABIQ17_04450 [Candidatus Limnocylindrales bacterium]
MDHSIAARYAARPTASFPRASLRIREPRLGLGAAVAFRLLPGRAIGLRQNHGASLASLRRDTRAIKPTRARVPASGRPRPAVSMTWIRSPRFGRSSASTAPWLG